MKRTTVLAVVVSLSGSWLGAQVSTDAARPSVDFARVGRAQRVSGSLERLQRVSTRGVTAVRVADRVLVADLGVVAPAGANLEARVRAFLGEHLPAIAPGIPVSELRLKHLPYSCDVAPSARGGASGRTFVFERAIGGVPVIGGAIAVRIEGDGTVVNVTNTLAPVRGDVVPLSRAQTDFRRVPALAAANRRGIATVIPDAKERRRVTTRATRMMLPLRDGDRTALMPARHITWGRSNGELMSGLLFDDGSVTAAEVVPATRTGSGRRVPRAMIDPVTKLPTFLSWRQRGGLSVSPVGVFDNPAEIAMRFLEENPSIFRSYAARCQFDVLDVQKSETRGHFVKLGQVVAGRRVFGAELVFEIEQGNRIQTIQGHTIGHAGYRLVPEMEPQRAERIAREQLDQALAAQPRRVREAAAVKPVTAELVIFPGELVSPKAGKYPTRLAYHTRSMLHGLFVDASSGDVLYGYSRVQGATRVVREGGGAPIVFADLYPIVSVNEVATTPGIALSGDAARASAALFTIDGFYLAHGWNGPDGGGQQNWTANVNVDMGTCPNAFSPPVVEQTYFCTGEAVPDVVGHESTHSVIWNSSNLVYADESGALNESYADIFGNLIFPDNPPTAWALGEARTAGAIRDMAAPVVPNYAVYRARNDLGCLPADVPGLGPGCDFGGVHTNSGITNLAHVLMSDGGGLDPTTGAFAVGPAAGRPLVGMGRPRVRELAFDVMTRRLTSWSRMVDSAVATRASCDAFRLAGFPIGPTRSGFRPLDCDQIPGAFATVGLDPDLISDWQPPVAGFGGTLVRYPGADVTPNGCVITDLVLRMNTPAGPLESQDSLAGAPLAVSYFGLETATIARTTPPIGGTLMTHTIAWTSVFGQQPQLTSVPIAPAPGGLNNCRGAEVEEPHESLSAVSTGIPFIGGTGTTTTGRTSTGMAGCTLVSTVVEMLDDSGAVIGDSGATATWSDVIWDKFVSITLSRTAALTRAPAGAPDLSAPVTWTYSPGVRDVRWRLRYRVSKMPGTICTP